jgi:hypothetical protein
VGQIVDKTWCESAKKTPTDTMELLIIEW